VALVAVAVATADAEAVADADAVALAVALADEEAESAVAEAVAATGAGKADAVASGAVAAVAAAAGAAADVPLDDVPFTAVPFRASERFQVVHKHSCAIQLLSPGSIALTCPDCCREREAGTCRAWPRKANSRRLHQSALHKEFKQDIPGLLPARRLISGGVLPGSGEGFVQMYDAEDDLKGSGCLDCLCVN
jgi:hypothetical protein